MVTNCDTRAATFLVPSLRNATVSKLLTAGCAEEMAGADFVKFPSTNYKAHTCPPLPIHISSSNNPAGPDLNQNHNLTWPDVFPISPCTSLAPALLSMSTSSSQFSQFCSFCSLFSFSELLPSLTYSNISYSSLKLGSFNIWFHQASMQNLHPYIPSLLFQAHLPTNNLPSSLSRGPLTPRVYTVPILLIL